MTRTDRAEVPVIECGELPLAEALEDGHDRGIDETELEIGIAVEQLAHPDVVATHQIDDCDRTVREIREEGEQRLSSKPVSDQPVQFDDDGCRHNELLAEAKQEIGACLVVRIGAIYTCVERPGIADQRHERGS